MFIWGINKGFDVTDEGFYLLLMTSLKANIHINDYVTLYHYLINFYSFNKIDSSVLNLRILNIILLTTASIYFTISLYLTLSYYKKIVLNVKNKILLFILSFSTTIYFLNYHPNNISYNSLNLIMILFSISSFLLFKIIKNKYNFLFLFLSSYFLTNLIYTKIVSFVLLFISLLILLLLEKKYLYIPFYIVSIFLSLLILLYFNGFSFESLFLIFTKAKILDNQAYSFSSQFLINMKFVMSYFFLLFCSFLLSRIISWMIIVSINKSRIKFLFAIIILLAYLILLNKYFSVWGSIVTLMFSSMLFPQNMEIKINKIKDFDFKKFYNTGINKFIENKYYFISILLLFLIPFIGASGSSSSFPLSSIVYLGFISTPSLYIALIRNDNLYTNILLGIAIIFMIKGTIGTYILKPYPFTVPPKTECLYFLPQFPRINGIKVTYELKSEAEKIYKKLLENDYKKNDKILGFYEIPGLVYLFEAKPIMIWEENRTDDYINININETSNNFFIIYDNIDMRNKPFNIPVDTICNKIKRKGFNLNKIYDSKDYIVYKAFNNSIN